MATPSDAPLFFALGPDADGSRRLLTAWGLSPADGAAIGERYVGDGWQVVLLPADALEQDTLELADAWSGPIATLAKGQRLGGLLVLWPGMAMLATSDKAAGQRRQQLARLSDAMAVVQGGVGGVLPGHVVVMQASRLPGLSSMAESKLVPFEQAVGLARGGDVSRPPDVPALMDAYDDFCRQLANQSLKLAKSSDVARSVAASASTAVAMRPAVEEVVQAFSDARDPLRMPVFRGLYVVDDRIAETASPAAVARLGGIALINLDEPPATSAALWLTELRDERLLPEASLAVKDEAALRKAVAGGASQMPLIVGLVLAVALAAANGWAWLRVDNVATQPQALLAEATALTASADASSDDVQRLSLELRDTEQRLRNLGGTTVALGLGASPEPMAERFAAAQNALFNQHGWNAFVDRLTAALQSDWPARVGPGEPQAVLEAYLALLAARDGGEPARDFPSVDVLRAASNALPSLGDRNAAIELPAGFDDAARTDLIARHDPLAALPPMADAQPIVLDAVRRLADRYAELPSSDATPAEQLAAAVENVQNRHRQLIDRGRELVDAADALQRRTRLDPAAIDRFNERRATYLHDVVGTDNPAPGTWRRTVAELESLLRGLSGDPSAVVPTGAKAAILQLRDAWPTDDDDISTAIEEAIASLGTTMDSLDAVEADASLAPFVARSDDGWQIAPPLAAVREAVRAMAARLARQDAAADGLADLAAPRDPRAWPGYLFDATATAAAAELTPPPSDADALQFAALQTIHQAAGGVQSELPLPVTLARLATINGLLTDPDTAEWGLGGLLPKAAAERSTERLAALPATLAAVATIDDRLANVADAQPALTAIQQQADRYRDAAFAAWQPLLSERPQPLPTPAWPRLEASLTAAADSVQQRWTFVADNLLGVADELPPADRAAVHEAMTARAFASLSENARQQLLAIRDGGRAERQRVARLLEQAAGAQRREVRELGTLATLPDAIVLPPDAFRLWQNAGQSAGIDQVPAFANLPSIDQAFASALSRRIDERFFDELAAQGVRAGLYPLLTEQQVADLRAEVAREMPGAAGAAVQVPCIPQAAMNAAGNLAERYASATRDIPWPVGTTATRNDVIDALAAWAAWFNRLQNARRNYELSFELGGRPNGLRNAYDELIVAAPFVAGGRHAWQIRRGQGEQTDLRDPAVGNANRLSVSLSGAAPGFAGVPSPSLLTIEPTLPAGASGNVGLWTLPLLLSVAGEEVEEGRQGRSRQYRIELRTDLASRDPGRLQALGRNATEVAAVLIVDIPDAIPPLVPTLE